ncbi:MAG: triose-phosphate isomerase, partial [Pirellulaceae bacterium]|nr:triose-phosphate isomerase [Pirellulaceae bacterium]
MRRYFIAGNWKMNLDRAASVELAAGLVSALGDTTQLDVAICPPAVYLEAVSGELSESPVSLGAQNMHAESSGAFTGELAGPMLADIGCRYVILGHSERRHLMGEDDSQVNKKLHAAFLHGLSPIVCVGETLADRQAGRTTDVIRAQFEGSLAGLDDAQMAITTIAYEPVWAIGTGEVATPDQAQEVHADLRSLIENSYNQDVGTAVRIQY